MPDGGFQPEKFDETLGLKESGVTSVVLATAGYRATDDKHADAPKVRFPAETVIQRV